MSNGLQKEVESQYTSDRFYKDAEFLRAYNKGIAHALRIAELRADYEFPGPEHFPTGMKLMVGGGSSSKQGINTNAEYETLTVGGKVSANERIIGGVSRLKKATKYRDFVADTLDKGLDIAAKGKQITGGKVNRINKAKKWTSFAVDTLDSGLDLGLKAKSLAGGKKPKTKRAPSAWISHVKKYAADHKIPYNQALKSAGASYKK